MPLVRSYSIDRGRTSELEKTGTGTATIEMVDTNGSLDPASGSTDYDPMKPVAIALRNPVTGTDHTIFRGHVSNWSYDMYPNEKYGIATIECVDGMDVLAAAELIPDGTWGDAAGSLGNIVYFKNHDGNACAVRINQVLNEVGWPAGLREIFSGNVKLQKGTYAPRSSALSVIEDTADAEFPGLANFYIQHNGANAGKATFHGRLARFHPADAQYHISTWKVGDIAAVQADSTRAVIFALEYDRDKDRIINSALATPQGIADADIELGREEDTASIAAYGTRSWSAENLLTDGDHFGAAAALDAVDKFAEYYAFNYAQPQTRVKTITFKGNIGAGSQYSQRVWQLMCNVEISDRIDLVTTHQMGGFNAMYFVEGLHYTAEPQNDQHLNVELTLDLSPAAYYSTNPYE